MILDISMDPENPRDAFLTKIDDIASFILYGSFGAPILAGLEYDMPEGTAWTFAKSGDNDFFKILNTSGILTTERPGLRTGTHSLMCTPFLGKGVPRWFYGIEGLVVSGKDGQPVYLAWIDQDHRMNAITYSDPNFQEKRRDLCSPRLSVNIS